MPSSPKKKTSSAAYPPIIASPLLAKLKGIVHGFSTRTGGVSQVYGENQLNLAFTAADSRPAVTANRLAFFAAIAGGARGNETRGKRKGQPAAPVVTLRQVHSGLVHIITEENKAFLLERNVRGDGLITNLPGVVLAVQVADCVPVLVADARAGVVGAFHAGWRGTAKRIVERGVGAMRARFSARPRDLFAAIGPCIHQCCDAVGEEVVDEFTSQFTYAGKLFRDVEDKDPIKRKYPMLFLTARAPGHSDLGPQTHLDLVEANRRQLLAAGLKPSHIWAAQECTSCRTDLLFSHRGDDGYTGRMMGAIGRLA